MIEIDLSEWNKWFVKYVQPVFIDSERESYYKKLKELQPPFYPKYWIAEKFYKKIESDVRFDEELKKTFAFLYACGFFMENIISFDEWLEMPNWENPQNIDNKSKPITEILKNNKGIYELKQRLRWLPFVNRPEGN